MHGLLGVTKQQIKPDAVVLIMSCAVHTFIRKSMHHHRNHSDLINSQSDCSVSCYSDLLISKMLWVFVHTQKYTPVKTILAE